MEKYYEAIEKFHKKFKMKGTNNEDMTFRLNLMIEELGELAEVVTKGKSKNDFIEENVDIFNLIIGNLISKNITKKEFDDIFWKKHEKIMQRKKKKINGKFRVSEFRK
ncbi:MAG: Glycyl-tRNA synthetase beta subunit [Candidatus Moranbacteria bacterium GW2011_GWF2_36_839]|nr:MAG: Glycyl-tRNA synthetase beta subunit [Candidatus Moranbacteria bacterium GW2011_GWF1_36_78]KKQ17267.1 MAG: Glycyl-tRNA synthetase beta subunit [Candidatus Moranbacteria bacterium GW2011_GWF2_36_839]HAT73890.1 pyrophosphatase [Candidatus Moranbacteria bacterium]HBY10967.1 pyrophosphatase [Candidatus Moranbacteria bacterium]